MFSVAMKLGFVFLVVGGVLNFVAFVAFGVCFLCRSALLGYSWCSLLLFPPLSAALGLPTLTGLAALAAFFCPAWVFFFARWVIFCSVALSGLLFLLCLLLRRPCYFQGNFRPGLTQTQCWPK